MGIGRSPEKILRHELIGLQVRVVDARDPTLHGITGTAVDESRNVLIVATEEKRISVPKNGTTFRFDLPDGVMVDVDGVRLVARPENRLKTKVMRR